MILNIFTDQILMHQLPAEIEETIADVKDSDAKIHANLRILRKLLILEQDTSLIDVGVLERHGQIA